MVKKAWFLSIDSIMGGVLKAKCPPVDPQELLTGMSALNLLVRRVWSLTQFYSVTQFQSRIKCVSLSQSIHTHNSGKIKKVLQLRTVFNRFWSKYN